MTLHVLRLDAHLPHLPVGGERSGVDLSPSGATAVRPESEEEIARASVDGGAELP